LSLLKRSERLWWRDAVTYQIYIRSFADSNGDGIGDIRGIISRLPYLKSLGIDAIWITPWFPSPQKDHGYDVANYFDIEADYGTLDDAKTLITKAHEIGIRILIDIVPNHCSDQHEWFQAALKAAPGSLERSRFHFLDGKGDSGELPPNNWPSVFGGQAWQRIIEGDGKLGQWYLHIFATEQPDFNWEHPDVREHFENILKFWLDLGVDGFRIDVAHAMIKAQGLPDIIEPEKGNEMLSATVHPFWDQEGVHEIHRSWRKILDSYPGDRMAVAEAWVSPASRIARYLRPDELANSFNFDFLISLWEAPFLKERIITSMAAMAEVGAPSSWVFNNHDVVRSVDRFDLGLLNNDKSTLHRQGDAKKFNLERGTQRARAGALLMLALPGGAYIYQGEELALPEVRDIPEDRLTDPRWAMSGKVDRGRDGCRVPLPWQQEPAGAFGFSTNDQLTPVHAWLPQSPWWGRFAVNTQTQITESTLNMYRQALAIRSAEAGLGDGPMEWLTVNDEVIAFSRPGNFICYVNFGAEIALPTEAEILLASGPIVDGVLPTDTAVWFRCK
jgi:alpha-glucosidase